MSAGGHIGYERSGHVGWITLERPDKLNSLAGQMREQLRSRIKEAAEAGEVRALVVTGAGAAFCAGGDVDAMAALRRQGDEAGFRALLHAGAEVILSLQAFPGLTVAAVNGVAAGAGLALALACDIRVATLGARFGATWGKLGLAPDWGASFWLPRLVGPARALEMVLSGRLIPAAEAAQVGLVHELVDEEELRATAQRIATTKGVAREAVSHAKYLIRAGIEGSLEQALAREVEAQEACFNSEDFAEGLAAFLEQRPARFRGK
ncbi:MAG: enoyl-CoA hydratase/isomerase family protein [Acidobacteriota bacterium]